MEHIYYEIDGRKYYQRPLSTLQQVLVETLVFDIVKNGLVPINDGPSFFSALGIHQGRLMAYVLIPNEMTIKDFVKKIENPDFLSEQIETFEYGCDPGTRYKVIMDFFVCNQIGLCIESVGNLMLMIQGKMASLEQSLQESNLNGSAPSSQGETRQAETVSTL